MTAYHAIANYLSSRQTLLVFFLILGHSSYKKTTMYIVCFNLRTLSLSNFYQNAPMTLFVINYIISIKHVVVHTCSAIRTYGEMSLCVAW